MLAKNFLNFAIGFRLGVCYAFNTMQNLRFKKLAFVAMLVAASATAQNFQPAAIVFKGADDFTNQELMDAAGLKLGMALSSDDVNAHAKQLMSSGMFESLGFRTEGDKLLIDLVPITQVFPVKIGNLPLESGPALTSASTTPAPSTMARSREMAA